MLINSFSTKNSLTGPAHDPYSVDTLIFVKDKNNTYTLTDNSLTEQSTIEHNNTIIDRGPIGSLNKKFTTMIGVDKLKNEEWMFHSHIIRIMKQHNLSYKDAINLYHEVQYTNYKMLQYAM